MNPKSKIYVAGHRGLVGSAIVRNLQIHGYANLLTRTHAELDLTDQAAVRSFFATEKPEYVFLAAAKVGGIHANNAYPAEFIHQNLAIQTNIIHESWRNNVKRMLFLGSSCIYPARLPPAHEGRIPLDRPAGDDQPALCAGQDCGDRDVLVVQPPVRHPVSVSHAHQPVWSR